MYTIKKKRKQRKRKENKRKEDKRKEKQQLLWGVRRIYFQADWFSYTQRQREAKETLVTEYCQMKMRGGRKFGDILCHLQNSSSTAVWRRPLSLAATLCLQNERKVNLALIWFSTVTLHILWWVFRGIILLTSITNTQTMSMSDVWQTKKLKSMKMIK